MSAALSPNTQAILLLTAPLIAGHGTVSPDLLTQADYQRLARWLREIECQPADLLGPDAAGLLGRCEQVVDAGRLQRLLSRGFLLSQVVEHWQARAIWVLSRADAAYPRRLKVRLREDAPALLYGCGDARLLDSGGLGVLGSHGADAALIEDTAAVGRLAARAGRTLVSGAAKGLDQAAMRGALEAGGAVSAVLGDGLEKAALDRGHRNALLEGRLVLISPHDPNAAFNAGHAMQRDQLIHALADAALVLHADLDPGGAWAGATEPLRKLVPVYVRTSGAASPSLQALRAQGAWAWPEPRDEAAFAAVFDAPPPRTGGVATSDEEDRFGG
jgi:predicted Rossmann fold nucleotide-binding protein DprA/Smf involved in DNA uptake